MPVGKANPERKTRGRAGCLTCRKRRRKCDERKPRCQNCETKDLSCAYPGFTILCASFSNQTSADSTSNSKTTNYKSITFADDADRASTPDSNPPSKRIVQNQITSRQSSQSDKGATAICSPVPLRPVEPILTRNSFQSTWDSFFCSDDALSPRSDAGLLLHFRYNLVPWIDAGNLDSRFSARIMQLADRKAPLSEAIIMLALRQLGPDNSTSETSIAERCLLLRQKVKVELAHEDSPTTAIGEMLLVLEEFFGLCPVEWSQLRFPRLSQTPPELSVELHTEPLRTLSRLQCRIELATSILMKRKPPLHVKSRLTSINRDVISAPSPSLLLYDDCLFHLAECLYLVNPDTEPNSGSTENSNVEPLLAISQPSSSSSWLHLWTKCQKWYEDRPPWAHPILEIRSLEARQIDTETFSSFPIQIYTTTIALLSNAVYHITSLLLLLRKPRLSTLPTQDRHLTSPIWHAQQIAGIATRNDFADQWDPVLIAGLLLISRDMTNKSQQDTLLGCLRNISNTTGILLGKEIEALQSHWAISCGSG
ncbi:hypothetical protein F5Y04DRAFT_147383 [Hypomontagnella monticulosa]|nr:hypothetical protein F5Y04DRAFT_147383 [Hypomontagnella monticulosa]